MTTIALDITGMTCAACAARVEKALSRVDGVSQATVNLALERATLELDDASAVDRVIGAVGRAGYGATARPSDEAERQRADERRELERRADERQTLRRFAIAALFTLPLVAGTLPMMLGFGHAWIGPWTQAALATAVLLACGTRFYREAFAALRGGSANMAVLVSLGTSVAYLYSMVLVVRGDAHAHLYFEAAAVVLTLVMLGKYLEARARRGAAAALRALQGLRPKEADRLSPDGATVTVAAQDLAPGDVVRVKPGAQIPCDGVIVAGHSTIDESLVTGESLPVERSTGSQVITGTVNGEAVIDVRVTSVGADTRLARMTRLIEEAQVAQAPVQRLVDRISAIFVPTILVVAALTFVGWWLWVGDPTQGMVAAVAVLVIACPCALGLATPTALVAGTGAAARAGILIRDVESLERAAGISTVAFDKTGTLTLGTPAAVATHVIPGHQDALALAASVERQSEHPLARALVDLADATGLQVGTARDVRAVTGMGLVGQVGDRRIAVGNRRLAEAEGVDAGSLDPVATLLAAPGTTSFIVVDGTLAGAVLLADKARPEAAAVISELARRQVRTIMLTGDSESAAAAIGSEIGVDDIRASLLPEHKVEAITTLQRELGEGIAFVGDGLNDGPALAAARLGVALSSGTDVAKEAAAITLMRPDLRLVPAAFDIAAATRRTIRQNLGWAFAYNVIGIPLAALGILSPVLAGAAMAFSSVSVVTNSALLARWRPPIVPER